MPVDGQWTYHRGSTCAVVEGCRLSGRAVALPAHFHDEDQVTLVLSGRRRFSVGDRLVTLLRGDTFVMPAGLVHASLGESDGVCCRNLYLPAGTTVAPGFDAALASWLASGAREEAVFVGLAAERASAALAVPARASLRSGETVGAAAARARMTREGFSRAFSRQRGLPPRPFGLITRLNVARAHLRAGEAPATAAAAAGFADQSHLGREFRRVFGVTPGRFRADTSQTFQTVRAAKS